MLFLFLSFQAIPTIIGFIEDEADISVNYNLDEEEMEKEPEQLKADSYEYAFFYVIAVKKSSKIISDNLRKHKSVFGVVFSPPPELNIV